MKNLNVIKNVYPLPGNVTVKKIVLMDQTKLIVLTNQLVEQIDSNAPMALAVFLNVGCVMEKLNAEMVVMK